MKRIPLVAISALVLLSSAVAVRAQTPASSPAASAFTGAWVLDKEKTGTKDVPKEMINYRMLVGESENLLNVKSQIEGKVEVMTSRDRVARSTGVTENTAGRTARSNTGVSAVASAPVDAERPNYGGTLALYYTPTDVTYNLTGEEQKVELRQGEKVNGIARIKAKLDKNGKSIQFSTVRRMKTNYGEIEVTTRENWKLSDDRKSLKLVRNVDSPSARDQITLILVRPPAK